MTNAQIDADGNQCWYDNNRFYHRLDGPAYIGKDGDKQYLIHGNWCENNTEFQKAANLSDEDMTAIVLKYGNVE